MTAPAEINGADPQLAYVVLPFRLSGLHIERVNLRALLFGVAAAKEGHAAVDNRRQRLRISREYPGSRRRKRPDNILLAPAATERSHRHNKQNTQLRSLIPLIATNPMPSRAYGTLGALRPTHAVI